MHGHSLNILMVTAWPPTRGTGGVNTMIRALSDKLAADHGVHVLVNDWDAVNLETARSDGLMTHSLRLRSPYDARHPVRGILGWLRDLVPTLRHLRRLFRAQAIDVVHLHYAASYQFYFRVLRMLGGPPYVVTLHRGDTVNFPNYSVVDRSLVGWTLRGAARVIAVSNWLAQLGEKTFPGCNRIACVHNGLDLDDIARQGTAETKGDLPVELPAAFLVNVANVTYYKGQDVAIRAWGRLRPRLPDLHLVIVGERREHWETCEELIRTLDLEDRVHMLGPLSQMQVYIVMSRAMGMVFPSRNEGFGLVLIEAGAMSLPTICSDIPPLREIVDGEESALFVPSEDPGALAEAVVRLVDNAELRDRLARALHDRVVAKFTAENMAERYLEIYREALND